MADKTSKNPDINKWMVLSHGCAVMLIGLSIGVLMGLSVSPVVSIIINGLMATVGIVVAILCGYKSENANSQADAILQHNLNPWPLALFVLFLVLGSGFGIRARTHHWLGSDLSSEIQKWNNSGIERDRVVERLFENSYPALSIVSESSALSETLQSNVQMWTALGLDQKMVTEKLFEQYNAIQQSNTTIPFESDATQKSVLYGNAVEQCDLLASTIDPLNGESFTDEESRAFINEVMTTDFIVLLELSDDADAISNVLQTLCQIY